VNWNRFNYQNTGRQSFAAGRLPKFSELRSRALISEFIRIPGEMSMPHGKGLNVVYADGSGQFVPSKYFLNNLMAGYALSGPSGNIYYLNGTYPAETGVWADFDRAH
jgi:prepilin-type processing-associated H-X9-DG protein